MIQIHYKHIIAISLFLLVFAFPFTQSFAQEKTAQKQQPAIEWIDIEHEAIAGMDIEKNTEITHDFLSGSGRGINTKEDEIYRTAPFDQIRALYIPTSYRNFNMLYWKTGRLNEEENDHIDMYLLLLHCQKVRKHFADDFEWRKVRQKTKAYLKANKQKFGKRFRFTQPIKLDEYNFDQGAFDIQEDFQYNNAKRLRVSDNRLKEIEFCVPPPNFFREYIAYAPLNMVISTRDPLNFRSIPMSENLSKHYLSYIRETGSPRVAYAVFYMNTGIYKGTKFQQQLSGGYLSEYSGDIDYIEVYADKEKKRLLYAKDMRR